MSSAKKPQNIYLPNGSEFEFLLTNMLASIDPYIKVLGIDTQELKKIKDEYVVYDWLIDYREWLKNQAAELNILKKNMRHLPRYEHMSALKDVFGPPPPPLPNYQPEGNLNKLVLDFIRKIVQSPNYNNEIGKAIYLDHFYWQRHSADILDQH